MFDSISMVTKAMIAGLLVGFFFAAIKLPIPAPPKLEGVVGIVGIFVGYWLFKLIFSK